MTGELEVERPLHRIADDITRCWRNPYYAAVPYIQAMRRLNLITDPYGHEDAEYVVLRFLNNAGRWQGEDAKRVKAELRAMLPRRQS